jgi:hypothetical protein
MKISIYHFFNQSFEASLKVLDRGYDIKPRGTINHSF